MKRLEAAAAQKQREDEEEEAERKRRAAQPLLKETAFDRRKVTLLAGCGSFLPTLSRRGSFCRVASSRHCALCIAAGGPDQTEEFCCIVVYLRNRFATLSAGFALTCDNMLSRLLYFRVRRLLRCIKTMGSAAITCRTTFQRRSLPSSWPSVVTTSCNSK